MSSSALTTREEPLADTSARSPIVVVGTITGFRHEEYLGTPITFWSVEVLESLRGEPGATLEVVVPGGPFADGRSVFVPGAPIFSRGETVLMHVMPRPLGAQVMTTWSQGLLRLREVDGRRVAAATGDAFPLTSLTCDGPAGYGPEVGRESVAADEETHPAPADPWQDVLDWDDAVAIVRDCVSTHPLVEAR